MASKNSDLWLWVGLSVLGYYAAMTVHTQLVNIRKASEVPRPKKVPDMLSQKTENALKLDTLGQLAENVNQDVKAAAVKIICERSLQDGITWPTMLRDIGGTLIERRNKALACVRFVLPYSRNNEKTDKMVYSARTYDAIVECLFGMTPEANIAESAPPNDAVYRSQPERDAMWILQHLLPFHAKEAREAGMISRWLAMYPFGGHAASYATKRQIMLDIVDGEFAYEDHDFGNAMQEILDRAFKIDEFREDMILYGLIDTSSQGNAASKHDLEGQLRAQGGWLIRDGNYIENEPEDGDELIMVGGPGNRRREESIEEQALRRRRRMAMVLGENGRAIESGDIIQRDPAVLDEEVEEELEQLIEEVAGQEETTATRLTGLIRSLIPGASAPLAREGDD